MGGLLAVFFVTPQVVEEARSGCQALELRALHSYLSASPGGRVNAASPLAEVLIRNSATGEFAAAVMRQRARYVPTWLSCPATWWYSLVDADTLSPARRR